MIISEIRETLEITDINNINKFIDIYKADQRAGVKKIIDIARKKQSAYIKELERTQKMNMYENMYEDYEYICGIDEVGRGPLAGPVVTAAVILKKNCEILYINDSKKLSAKKRGMLYKQIMTEAIEVSIGLETYKVIDSINILQATYKAMKTAIESLKIQPSIILVDAIRIPNIEIEQVPIIKGDTKSISIAASSIIAKVTRDRIMIEYDKVYPGYGFAENKGYGSQQHIIALKTIGPCPIHRQSFIKNIL